MWGKSHFSLAFCSPWESECAQNREHNRLSSGAIRQFIREMTFLMRNTCWKGTKGLVWSERCSWISSEVHEKVISFTRHTLSSGISSGSRCCPAQMLNKWNKCPESLKKKKKLKGILWVLWPGKSLANNELKKERLKWAICCWIHKIIHNHLKLNREIGFQLRKIEIMDIAAVVQTSSGASWKWFGEYCLGWILKMIKIHIFIVWDLKI